MEKKNWAKKIVALGTGALMLGATLTGALAASDLADYPAPFVQNGVLNDTVIVVGASAQTADVLGAVDIAAALQAAAVSKEPVEVGTTVAPTVDAGVKIEKSGDKYNYGEDLYDVQSTALDNNDLDMLENGVFKDNKGTNKGDEDYDQKLIFGNTDNVWQLEFTQPGKNDNYPDGRPAGNYLHLDKNKWVYNYTLEFDTPVTVANAADLEGTSIDIQGNTYTITDATVSGGAPTKLTLVSGDSTVWLAQDQPYTVGDHTVTVVDVDSGETKCGINVDGVTLWVDDGSTEEFGDLSVGVLDVVAVYTKDYDADTCELSLGSNEIKLEDGQEISVNGETLDGSNVDFFGTWDGMRIKYKVGDDSGLNQDEIFLAPGESWTDPVFGNFKVLFEGVTANYENMKLSVSSDEATFTFTNNDGKEVDVPFYYNTTGIYLGQAEDEVMLLPGEEAANINPEGVMLFYTTSGGEAHVLQITDLTCGSSTNKTTIKDLTYGTYVAKDAELTKDCADQTETISLGSLGSVQLNITSSSVYYGNGASYGNGEPESKYEGNFTFSDHMVYFTEKAGDEMSASTISFNLSYDSSDETINVGTIRDDGSAMTWYDNDQNDDNTKWAATPKGTILKYDDQDKLWLEIQAPEEDAYANVFVAPLNAKVTSGGSNEVMSEKVNPFSVGLAVLDTDAASMSKNMIVVGGPCVNTVAADLMGNPENCAEGFEEGKAIIKFYDNEDKVALLVAGATAQDTRGAAYVLADYNDYDLSGDEVEVVVASLNDITVS